MYLIINFAQYLLYNRTSPLSFVVDARKELYVTARLYCSVPDDHCIKQEFESLVHVQPQQVIPSSEELDKIVKHTGTSLDKYS